MYPVRYISCLFPCVALIYIPLSISLCVLVNSILCVPPRLDSLWVTQCFCLSVLHAFPNAFPRAFSKRFPKHTFTPVQILVVVSVPIDHPVEFLPAFHLHVHFLARSSRVTACPLMYSFPCEKTELNNKGTEKETQRCEKLVLSGKREG